MSLLCILVYVMFIVIRRVVMIIVYKASVIPTIIFVFLFLFLLWMAANPANYNYPLIDMYEAVFYISIVIVSLSYFCLLCVEVMITSRS